MSIESGVDTIFVGIVEAPEDLNKPYDHCKDDVTM